MSRFALAVAGLLDEFVVWFYRGIALTCGGVAVIGTLLWLSK